MRTLALSGGLIAAMCGGAATAADVTVRVLGLRSAEGAIRVAICPEDRFTRAACPYAAAAPASRPAVTVAGVPDGVYAVQAFHDEDGDGRLDRRGLRPSEGLAFSNDAPMRMGPPRFRDAAVRVRGNGMLTLTMRYFE